MSRIELTVHILLAFAIARHGRRMRTSCGVHGLRSATETLTSLCKQQFRSSVDVDAEREGTSVAIRLIPAKTSVGKWGWGP